jgi:hypothetical protein
MNIHEINVRYLDKQRQNGLTKMCVIFPAEHREKLLKYAKTQRRKWVRECKKLEVKNDIV